MFIITRAVFCQPITFLSVLHSAGVLQPKLGSSHLRGKYKLSQLTLSCAILFRDKQIRFTIFGI